MYLKSLKFLFVFFCYLFFVQTIRAQSIDAIKADRANYIWGEGIGATLKEADQNALSDIIGQISTQVESSFEKVVVETGDKFKQTVNDVLKTYSSATLKNTERIVLQNEPDAKVFRYVKRSEVARVFEARKNKLIELAHNGEAALKDLQIADALRYFYWSQTLLRSHPESSDIRMKTANGEDVLLVTWLPMQINQILGNLSIRVSEVEKKDNYSNYLLSINYKNEPVRNFDYTYWSGQDWSNIVSAKDGLGVVELPSSAQESDIRIKAEYVFDGETSIDMELRDVMQKLPSVPYKSSYITVNQKKGSENPTMAAVSSTTQPVAGKLQNAAIPKPTETSSMVQATTFCNLGSMHELQNVADKEEVMKKVISAIKTKNFESIPSLFSGDGYSVFQRLLMYGNARILGQYALKFYEFGEFSVCRSLPMSFKFKTNNRTFVENVVFYFDKNNKICNLTFGLGKKATDDIASNTTWPEQARMILMNFMENYKTAYSLKRLDYIESIFSDNALIITGNVTKVNNSPEFRYLNNNIVKYNRQSKEKYIKNLGYSFKSNEFVNIRFADNTVRRSGRGNDVYGIQIKQDYFSSNYGDSGYLFLLIDITDAKKPLIHVRTWQPEKNPDGSIYGLSDF